MECLAQMPHFPRPEAEISCLRCSMPWSWPYCREFCGKVLPRRKMWSSLVELSYFDAVVGKAVPVGILASNMAIASILCTPGERDTL